MKTVHLVFFVLFLRSDFCVWGSSYEQELTEPLNGHHTDALERWRALRLGSASVVRGEEEEGGDTLSLTRYEPPRRSVRRERSNVCASLCNWIRACFFCGEAESNEVEGEAESFPDYFVRTHLLEEEGSPFRRGAAKVCSAIVAAGTGAVLGYQGYLFVKSFHGDLALDEELGIPLAVVSFMPPFMGMSSLLYERAREFFFPERSFSSHAHPFGLERIVNGILRLPPVVITAAPIAFVGYDTMSRELGDFSYVLAGSVLCGFYAYYDKTTRDFAGRVHKKIKASLGYGDGMSGGKTFQHACEDITGLLGKLDAETVMALKHRLKSDPSGGFASLFGLLARPPASDIEDLALDRVADSGIELLGRAPRAQRPSCGVFSWRNAALGTSVLIAAAGTSFFYPLAQKEVYDIISGTPPGSDCKVDIKGDELSAVSTVGAVLTAGCRGAFNIMTSLTSATDLMGLCCSSSKAYEPATGEASIDRAKYYGLRLLDILKYPVAAIGAIPSTEISFCYLGTGPEGIALSACTAQAIFMANLWAMNLRLNKLRRSESEEARDTLKEFVQELRFIYPRLKAPARRYLDNLIHN